MDRYLLKIEANDKPVLVERILRVVRHRGFTIKQILATQNHESKVAQIELVVDSDRPITLITNQVEKLWDVTNVHTSRLKKDEMLSAYKI
ncbi:acetolactate synthase 2 small subunit [Vibrio sp. DW001]|jgi:acetolactate synthase II small subunit|uniref:acetolactate synthase 2 small subunit n=1 Tax=unclassified Vibrio TaxID=2614977 RepID=UPI0018A0912F|nr:MULTISPECIES: acetolactate synthase 2 small subunit [unclassified Vibrio]UGA54786.1 acetolactate synthase 2 small subunit [Vibrio sp. VB16]WED26674.1 acetolactate synthase 2 small subunit [Vibrio sp. DW001]